MRGRVDRFVSRLIVIALASPAHGDPRRRLRSRRLERTTLAALAVASLSGCCRLANSRYPVPALPDDATVVLYGDSFVNRLSTLTGYSAPVGARLQARGEIVADEGNAGREAAIGAITDPVNDRCCSLVCQVFYDCLSKGNDPLVTVLGEHPKARKLLVTLGGVELMMGMKLAYGDPWQVPDPTHLPRILDTTAQKVFTDIAKMLDIALADRHWDWIGITSYPYMPADSRDPVVACPLPTPIGPADQKIMNDEARTLDAVLRTVAERKGVHFISLLDVLGGGEAVPGGENGSTGRYFDDCGHPTPEGYELVADRLMAGLG